MKSEEVPLEGQSCGRNENSVISEVPIVSERQNAKNVSGEPQIFDLTKSLHDQEKQEVSEDQVLDISESILRQLSEKLIENGWSVKDVFDHPKLITVVPEYDGKTNVKTLAANNFLGRLFQLGFEQMTVLQVTCLLQVLVKADLENAIAYEELKSLLQNYGVPDDQNDQPHENSQNSPPEAKTTKEEEVEESKAVVAPPVEDQKSAKAESAQEGSKRDVKA